MAMRAWRPSAGRGAPLSGMSMSRSDVSLKSPAVICRDAGAGFATEICKGDYLPLDKTLPVCAIFIYTEA